MKEVSVKITSIDKVTHDVLKIVTSKPEQFSFTPGQAAEVSINKAVLNTSNICPLIGFFRAVYGKMESGLCRLDQ